MIKWLQRLLMGKKNREELETLYRYRIHITDYRRWLSQMPDICETLGSLQSWVEGRPFDSVLHGEGHRAWHIQDLREELYAMRKKP